MTSNNYMHSNDRVYSLNAREVETILPLSKVMMLKWQHIA